MKTDETIAGRATLVGWHELAFQDPLATIMFADQSGRLLIILSPSSINFGRFLCLQFTLQNEADLSKIKKKEATKLDR